MEERGEITFRNDGVDVTRINLRYWDRSCHYDEFHVRVNITKAQKDVENIKTIYERVGHAIELAEMLEQIE